MGGIGWERPQEAALRNLRGHLAADGRLLIDVFLPRKLLTECPSAPVLRREAVDPATGRPVRCLVAYRFDRGRQLEFRRHIFEIAGEDGNFIRHEFETIRRYFFPEELEALFGAHGLMVEAVFGGYGKEPVRDDAEHLLYVLRREEGR